MSYLCVFCILVFALVERMSMFHMEKRSRNMLIIVIIKYHLNIVKIFDLCKLEQIRAKRTVGCFEISSSEMVA